MKKLTGLTKPVDDLDGNPIPGETVGKMMANVLARAQSDDPVRAMMIAMQIYKEKSVDLEDADFALVHETVNTDRLLTNLGRAALLTALNGAIEKTVKEK